MAVFNIENQMVINAVWWWNETTADQDEENEKPSRYVALHSDLEVLEEDALEYATEHEEREEGLSDAEFVDWFFSGNWIYKKGGVKDGK